MGVDRQDRFPNLKRGGGVPRRISMSWMMEGKRRAAAEDARLEALAEDDPYAPFTELHRVMASHMSKLLRRDGNRSR